MKRPPAIVLAFAVLGCFLVGFLVSRSMKGQRFTVEVVSQLHFGQTFDEVQNILGPPDRINCDGSSMMVRWGRGIENPFIAIGFMNGRSDFINNGTYLPRPDNWKDLPCPEIWVDWPR
jgi:hypothetical protein